ncbi:hypothetical protein [Actinoalloteichus spitiensis]|uniref:hypothetical protein n=1 Tax=Actinoalloteichus spitiensis TaxID=252394 RepID=UPI0012F69BAE|nr:hypothetical protein [Actinoalloteichus spitiensis]
MTGATWSTSDQVDGHAPRPPSDRTSPADEPFPSTLRAAIAASGLSLDRIRYRLEQHGHHISVATLSYWQSGRSRPERRESLNALRQLERLLTLPPSTLRSLLGPPRPRGRNKRLTIPSIASLWPEVPAVPELLSSFDVRSDTSLERISHHDVYSVGASGSVRRIRTRQVLRARREGPDRCLVVFDPEHPDLPALTPHAIRNCRVGRVARSGDTGLVVAELVLPSPLARGTTTILEFELVAQPGGPARARTTECSRRFVAPVREYLLEVSFSPEALPVALHRFVRPSDQRKAASRTPLALGSEQCAHVVELDVLPGTVGICWEWPAP